MAMATLSLLVMLSLVMILAAVAHAADLTQCSGEVTKLTECFKYSSGEEDAPTDKCCAAVSDIKDRDPVCLCYIIQQTSESSSATNGLRIDRLLELPKACKIANASASYCPKLLNLPPGSPAYAIFNGSVANTSTSPANSKNSCFRVTPRISTAFVAAAAASAIFFSFF